MIRRTLIVGLALAVVSGMSAAVALPAAQASSIGVAARSATLAPVVSGFQALAVPLAPPVIDVNNVKAHLQQFQTIATNNGGNRATGTGGHTQTVAYLKGKLEAAGYTVTLQTCSSCNGSAQNVIADWPGGDVNSTYMFGAHADSVSAGPGINDDGSGVASDLEVALQLAAAHPTMVNHVRFGFWTGEEQGLVGSKFYVTSLTTAQRNAIKAYGTMDMVASLNGGYFVNGTDPISVKLRAYFASISVATETSGECCSDDGSFRDAGIPTSLTSTGASATKTSAQVTKWGGTAGAAYDSCYHRSCDSYPSNVNSTSLGRFANSVAYSIWNLAVGTGTPTNDFSLSASPSSGSVAAGSSATTTVGTATTSGSAQTVTFSATGAPSGVTVSFSPASVTSGSSSTATVSVGGSVPAGTSTITITGTGASATHTVTYALTVTTVGGGCTAAQLIVNGGFESGTTPWTGSTGAIGAWGSQGEAAHGGTRSAWLGGYGSAATDTVTQSVTIPTGCTTANLSYYLHIDTAETGTTVYDKFTVKANGTVLTTLSNANAASGYTLRTLNLAAYAGQTVTVTFTGTEDASLQTSFVLDDVTLQVG